MRSQQGRPPRRQAFVLAQASDFTFSYKGREVRWLSKALGAILAPIFNWRMRRGWRPTDRER